MFLKTIIPSRKATRTYLSKRSEIDREEKDVLTAYERDEWRPVAERDAEIERYRGYARAVL